MTNNDQAPVTASGSDGERFAMQTTLLHHQQRLMGLAGAIVARRIVTLFDRTPRLKRLKIQIRFEWTSHTDAPTRQWHVTVDSSFSPKVVDDGLVSTALGNAIFRGDARAAQDVEVDFNLALEDSTLVRELARDLDCGRDDVLIDASRRAIDQHRDAKSGRTDLASLCQRFVSF